MHKNTRDELQTLWRKMVDIANRLDIKIGTETFCLMNWCSELHKNIIYPGSLTDASYIATESGPLAYYNGVISLFRGAEYFDEKKGKKWVLIPNDSLCITYENKYILHTEHNGKYLITNDDDIYLIMNNIKIRKTDIYDGLKKTIWSRLFG